MGYFAAFSFIVLFAAAISGVGLISLRGRSLAGDMAPKVSFIEVTKPEVIEPNDVGVGAEGVIGWVGGDCPGGIVTEAPKVMPALLPGGVIVGSGSIGAGPITVSQASSMPSSSTSILTGVTGAHCSILSGEPLPLKSVSLLPMETIVEISIGWLVTSSP